MFGNKLATAQAQIASLLALVASTGFKFEATEEAPLPSAEAFTAHLAKSQKAAVDAAVAPHIAAGTALQTENSAFRAGIVAAGVKLADFKAADFAVAEGKTAADTVAAVAIKDAIGIAIAAKSARQISAAGHPNALDIKAGDDDAPATATSTELKAQYDALTNPAARADFYAKHKSKLLS